MEELWRMRDETASHAPILHFADTDGDEEEDFPEIEVIYTRE